MTPPEGDAAAGSLRIVRRHTQAGVHPYEEITWETRTARVGRVGEPPKFEQTGVEVPETWSQNATDIVAQKYFAYDQTDPRREFSVRQLIDRVVKKIGAAGMEPQPETGRPYFLSEEERETFEAELTHILIHQKAAFNSPVWFNIGVEGAAQQSSACQPYHAPVSTPEGFVPIGELVERNAVGERVLDVHGETTIIAVKNNGRKPVLRIHTHSGHQLDVTPDHLVWRDQGRTFVPAGELVVGDQISWVRTPLRDSCPASQQTSEAALAGWLQADVFVGQYAQETDRSLTLEAEMVTADEREWVLAAVGSVFPNATPNESAEITADSNLDYRRLRWYGEPCRPFVEKWELLRRRQHRIIAPHLFSAPKEEVVAYLRSVFQADGFVSIRENGAVVAMQTSSEALSRGVQRLLGGLGIFARVMCKHDSRPDRMDGWAVFIGNRGDQELFRDQVGFVDRRKSQALNKALLRRGQSANASKRLTIERIELLGEMDVYDIQTTSGEYLSNNLRVHNCFILSVEDSLESISNWQTEESRIFQRGSGAGVNLSNLRGSMEKLALGGTSSGPVTFMRGADANAGTIQSGGTCLAPTQRVYTAEHGPVPVAQLAQAGLDFTVLSYDPPAGRYKAKTARAWEMPSKRVVRIHTDKGQFDLTYDHPVKLSSGPFVEAAQLQPGMSLFACSIDEQHGHLRVHLRDGRKGKEFFHRLIAADVMGHDLEGLVVDHDDENKHNNTPSNLKVKTQSVHATRHGRLLAARGEHIFQLQKFSHAGEDNGMHTNSPFWSNPEAVESYCIKQGEILRASGRAAEMQKAAAQQKMLNTAFKVLNAGHCIDTFEDYVAGRRQSLGGVPSVPKLRATIEDRFGSYESFRQEVAANNHRVIKIEELGEMTVYDVEVDCPTADDKTPLTGHNFVIWPDASLTGSGFVVANTRRAAKLVALDIDHPDVEDFIWCKAREEDRIRALQAAGFEMGMGSDVGEKNLAEATAYQNANNSVRVTQEFLDAVEADDDWHLRARGDGAITKTVKARALMRMISEAAWRCADPGLQYDTTINDWHTTPAQGRITASNPCAEFMSNDNTSCNLASLNLLKFLRPDGSFDVEDFQHCTRILFIAQDITIIFANFPTQLIGENTRALRQIGTGFANLGALLMALGLPYDSQEGRALAGAITALLTGECYLQSTYLAERVGAFSYYKENEKAMMRVIRKHRAAVSELPEGEQVQLLQAAQAAWSAAARRGARVGFRNAQATVLAPTGCLDPSTLVVTDKGLLRLGKLGDVNGAKWQNLSLRVATDEGPRAASKFYVNDLESVVEVVTARGYRLRGTPAHRIKVVDESGEWVWRRLGELQTLDRVPLMLNNLIGQPVEVRLPVLSGHTSAIHRVPTTMSFDLAEFVGYFMGDGSLHAEGLRLTVANGDDDVLARLHELAQSLFGMSAYDSHEEGCISVYLNSVALAAWWDACGFSKRRPHSQHHGKGWLAHIPNAVLHTNDRAVYSAFLRGLFEADGNANHGYAYLATADEDFARELQTMMLALGHATRLEKQTPRQGGQQFSNKPWFRVRTLNKTTATRFANDIGFISERKNRALISENIRQGARYDDIPLTRATVNALAGTNDNLRKNLLLQLNRKNAVSRRAATTLLERAPARAPERVGLELLLGYFFDTVSSTELCSAPEPTYDLSVPENVTYIANGFVSHNTIAFMMDCDTTGIEPDFSLIKGKSMAGGGQLLMPNRTIPMALKKLGYSAPEIDDIIAYIAEEIDKGEGYKGPRGTVSGAPHLLPEHYPVFDCAIGERAITWRGHVDMVAACQPFLSGSASKTINLPESATVEDHEDVYIYCGKIGLKAVALYRDNCKAFQPLSDAKTKDRDPDVEKALIERRTSILGDGLLRGERRQVPRKARTNSTNFDVGTTAGYIFVREFEDGRPGAIFIDVGQAGSTLAGFIKALSVTMSLGFQYGMALDVLISKLVGMQFEPGGFTADPEIRQARSLVDYIVKWLALEYLDPSVRPELGIGLEISEIEAVVTDAEGVAPQVEVHAEPRAVASAVADTRTGMRLVGTGNLCNSCGAIMQPTGACYTCPHCGNSSGGCG